MREVGHALLHHDIILTGRLAKDGRLRFVRCALRRPLRDVTSEQVARQLVAVEGHPAFKASDVAQAQLHERALRTPPHRLYACACQ